MNHVRCAVTHRADMGGDCYKVGLNAPEEYAGARPGQFVMLRLAGQTVPLLGRPFSIHRLVKTNGGTTGFEVLFKVVGPFTAMLSRCAPGDLVEVAGPLGAGCFDVRRADRVFLAAGGIGAAPMPFLAEAIRARNGMKTAATVFIGGRSAADILCRADFEALGMDVRVTTEDGGAGEKGLVTDAMRREADRRRPDVIYACGPPGMLRAVAALAAARAVPCQIAVETIMACGVGACLGCAVENAVHPETYLHVCKDGPVFDAGAVRI